MSPCRQARVVARPRTPKNRAGPPFSAPPREVTLQEGSGRALLLKPRGSQAYSVIVLDELVDAEAEVFPPADDRRVVGVDDVGSLPGH
jgi:hypothetical protein